MWSNFWNLRVNDRLTQWKDFRHQIGQLPFETALSECNKLWSSVPYVGYYLDPSNPQSWPDPWTMLAENYWCDVAKALGIVYTDYFSQHQSRSMELKIYYDYHDKSRYNLSCFEQGKYILNFYPYEIVNTELVEQKNLKSLYHYSTQDLALDKY
jgi:hypothetical protein